MPLRPVHAARPPWEYPRRVLIAVTGLSPQVLTETLYALAVGRQPPFVPTEVHVISTSDGAEQARLTLLTESPGWFRRMIADFSLPAIEFDESHIHVLRAADGKPLSDIRTPADNEAAADAITELMRNFTSDDDAAVHVSIAGGRKTMGYYLGYALSLFGRPHDRLSHVLVSEPYESNREFFYPTPYSYVIAGRDQKRMLDAADAVVELAEIPFVSMRHGIPDKLLSGTARFHEAVTAANTSLGPPSLVLDLRGRSIRAGGVEVRLPPAHLALLSAFARHAKAGGEALRAPPKGAPDEEWARRYMHEYRLIVGELGDDERAQRAREHGMEGDQFSQPLARLRKTLKRHLGLGAKPYLIDDGGTRPKRYRLALPPDAIRFVD